MCSPVAEGPTGLRRLAAPLGLILYSNNMKSSMQSVFKKTSEKARLYVYIVLGCSFLALEQNNDYHKKFLQIIVYDVAVDEVLFYLTA